MAHSVAVGLSQQGQWFGVEMLGEKLKENLFVLLPPESVFGVTYLESFKMQLPEQALVGIAI